MAYYYGGNNGFYNPYAQPMQDQLQQLRQTQQPMNGSIDDRIFVQGELAAQAYLVAPSSFVRLWDSTQNVFYEKRADTSGRPYMEAYEYKKRDNLTTQGLSEPSHTNVYDEKINALSNEISALRGKIEALERMKGADNNDAKSICNDSTV